MLELLKKHSGEIFDDGVYLGKFSLLFGLLIISVINADGYFASKEPREFIGECIAVGTSALAASLMLGYNRGLSWKKLLNVMFIVFFVFFVFHVCMEFSGANNIGTKDLHPEDHKQQEWINRYILNKYLEGFIGICFCVMGCLAVYKHDFSYSKRTTILNGISEMIAFGLINASPTIMVSRDRGLDWKSSLKDTGKMTVAYSALYLLLEGGGFFTREFGTNEITIEKNE
jgi:hypothetical protein